MITVKARIERPEQFSWPEFSYINVCFSLFSHRFFWTQRLIALAITWKSKLRFLMKPHFYPQSWNQIYNIFTCNQNLRGKTTLFKKLKESLVNLCVIEDLHVVLTTLEKVDLSAKNHCLLHPPCVLYSSTLLVNRSAFKFDLPSSSVHQSCRKLFVRHSRASPQARPVKLRSLGLQGLSRATKKQIAVVVALHSPNPITVSRQASNGEVLSLL
jgi:hypothetical protein